MLESILDELTVMMSINKSIEFFLSDIPSSIVNLKAKLGQ